MKLFISLLLLFLFATIGFSQTTLTVNVKGLKNNKGQVILLLFKKGHDFGIKEKAFKQFKQQQIENNKTSFVIADLEKGEYAYLVYHDSDKNEKFATNWLGMPKEGIGKSGIQGKRPTYENSKFQLTNTTHTFTSCLKYIF